jgi:hypothetical protein
MTIGRAEYYARRKAQRLARWADQHRQRETQHADARRILDAATVETAYEAIQALVDLGWSSELARDLVEQRVGIEREEPPSEWKWNIPATQRARQS